jgi:hypothetical protein
MRGISRLAEIRLASQDGLLRRIYLPYVIAVNVLSLLTACLVNSVYRKSFSLCSLWKDEVGTLISVRLFIYFLFTYDLFPSPVGIAGSIPAGAWTPLCCECCVLSVGGLCFGLITCPEKSLRVWCV